MDQGKRTGIHSMPTELLEEVFSLLYQPPHSIKNSYDQPFHDVTNSTTPDLELVSYVSRRLRQAVLPILFQYARMILPIDNFQTNWTIELQDFLTFVRRHYFESRIHSMAAYKALRDKTQISSARPETEVQERGMRAMAFPRQEICINAPPSGHTQSRYRRLYGIYVRCMAM
jgi:hypothetical protein